MFVVPVGEECALKRVVLFQSVVLIRRVHCTSLTCYESIVCIEELLTLTRRIRWIQWDNNDSCSWESTENVAELAIRMGCSMAISISLYTVLHALIKHRPANEHGRGARRTYYKSKTHDHLWSVSHTTTYMYYYIPLYAEHLVMSYVPVHCITSISGGSSNLRRGVCLQKCVISVRNNLK